MDLDKNFKYKRTVDMENFMPMLEVEKENTHEKWIVSVENIVDQQAFLGDKFSMVEFLEKYGKRI